MMIYDKEKNYDDDLLMKKIEYRGVFDIGLNKFRVYFIHSDQIELEKNQILAVHERGKYAGYVKYHTYTGEDSSEKLIKEFISDCIKKEMDFRIKYMKELMKDARVEDANTMDKLLQLSKELGIMKEQRENLLA